MARERIARRGAGQRSRGRAVVPLQPEAGTESDGARNAADTTPQFPITEDPARLDALAAEFDKLDAEGRLTRLHQVLKRPIEQVSMPAASASASSTAGTTDHGENATSHTAPTSAGRHWLLQEAERIARDFPVTGTDLSAMLQAAYANTLARRLLKTAVGLAIVIVVGWGPAQRLMQTTSVEAVVNARLVTLRTPIEGQIAPANGKLAVGATVDRGTPLLRIVNPRADRTRLDELRRLIERLEYERSVAVAKLETARALHAEFVTQTQKFQDGRVRQLEGRIAELRSEIAMAVSRREEAADVLARTEALAARGYQTRASLDKARRERDIADQAIAVAEQRARTVEIELDAARAGTFVGDSYNDRPRSSQRADELQQQVVELSAELKQSEARMAMLKTELVEERARFADLAEATVAAPSHGAVWEMLTAPGEQVNRGQELLRVLDCSTAVVTATVSESVYNRLQVGAPARFRFRDGGGELDGYVVHLTGVAEAPANLAIAPRSLIKEAYRVTVAIPSLTQSPTCQLGRTGRVVFGEGSGSAGAVPVSKP
jgi:multidrug resistance efflux pump